MPVDKRIVCAAGLCGAEIPPKELKAVENRVSPLFLLAGTAFVHLFLFILSLFIHSLSLLYKSLSHGKHCSISVIRRQGGMVW